VNSTDQAPPQYCPPTEACQVSRSMKGTCGFPQGVLEPWICHPGYYCPPGGKSQLTCPKGYFCPQGSYQPTKCDFGAICPEKSSRQIGTVPLYLVIAIDVALAIAVAIGFAVSKWRKLRRSQNYTNINMDGPADDIELLHSAAMPGYAEQVTDEPEPEPEEEYHTNPDFQRFIRSLSRTIETKEVGLAFDFEDPSFEPTPGKKILSSVTGSIERGSMWGIMGGSGAGKSTFVNVLMGKTKNTGGVVKINGYVKDTSQYKKLISYVPQDDIVFPELTVRENILHSARIRLPSSWKDSAIQDHVDSLISCLALTHVQHSRVGDANKPIISGGQRKRVSIGMELAAAPMAIFLDEPTSGLDATSAASIMRLLKAISRLGVTTIAIIHQPREQIFAGFDSILLLGQGRQLYGGPLADVQSYFTNIGFAFPTRGNPADTIMDIITGDG
ncbi:hypothetical protein LTR66_015221, partial [Elasticomyces elasticus]